MHESLAKKIEDLIRSTKMNILNEVSSFANGLHIDFAILENNINKLIEKHIETHEEK